MAPVKHQTATVEQLKALAHPLRWRILRLCRDVSRTNQELANRLGVAAPTMLRHVRLLVAQGFLAAEEPRVGPAGGTERPYRATGLTLTLSVDDSATMDLRRQVDLAVLAAHGSEFIEVGPAAVRDSARGVLRLGSRSQRELIDRLGALLSEYRVAPERDGEDLAFLWHLAQRPDEAYPAQQKDGPDGTPGREGQRTVVVTGATGGLGAAIVRSAVARGDRVIAAGRSSDQLDSLCAPLPTATSAVLDLHEPGDLPPVLTGLHRLDALVHCAGVAEVAAVAQTTWAAWQRAVSVNLVGAAELTRALLPGLRAAGGHVVFVNASPNLRAVPRWSTYTATKAALREFADSLREEEDGNGVRVTSIHPGAIGTDLLRRIRTAFGKDYDENRVLTPESVASVVLTVLGQPPDVHMMDVSLRRAPAGARSRLG